MDDHNHKSHTGTKVIAWLALILSLLALGLAWLAYNRTGADLEERIQNQVQQGANNIQEGAQDAANEAQDAAGDAAQAIDEGPDGVDDDDTETAPQSTTPQQ